MATKKLPASGSSEQQNAPSAPAVLASKLSSGCCKGTTQCSTPTAASATTLFPTSPAATKKTTTQIIVKYDVGFNNQLFLRGKGASLSWDKGIPLKNVKRDEWVWESNTPFSSCEFKVLINDKHYETGENHTISSGATVQYIPKF